MLRDTVAAPIENKVNGVEDMIYMSSKSANDGTYTLSVTFAVGTDPNMAQVLVQNRVNQSLPVLPIEVQRIGVSVEKQSSEMLLIVNLYSPEGTFNSLELSNYASINITDPLARINGVSQVNILAEQEYAMRVWLDSDRIASLGLTPADISNAINEQNVQVAPVKSVLRLVQKRPNLPTQLPPKVVYLTLNNLKISSFAPKTIRSFVLAMLPASNLAPRLQWQRSSQRSAEFGDSNLPSAGC